MIAALVPAINPADNPLSAEFYRLLAQNLGPALLPLLTGMAVTVALVLPARWLSFRVGAVSHPGGRNIHTQPTGRLGGIALAAGFLVSALLYATRQPGSRTVVTTVVAAGIAVILAYTYDDLRPMRARTQLAVSAAVAVAVVAMGVSIQNVGLGRGAPIHLGILAIPISIFWLMGMQNTMNLMDGVDGLAAGVAAIVAAALLLAAVNRLGDHPEGRTVIVLSAALVGACVGFLFFNFHPARIFMGAGAHFLGVTLGIISILGVAKGAVVFALVVPVMALLIPIVDTAWAIIRRRRQLVSIGHPDNEHIHHQLLDFGLSQRQTCLVFYFGTGITASLGLMLFGHRKILGVAVVLLVVALSTLLGERLNEIEVGQGAEGSPTTALLES
ncbi:MAG: glycosyltransferase family 4 protein [Candidatus Dormibacteria bacterium]